jgi:hypothetical protein
LCFYDGFFAEIAQITSCPALNHVDEAVFHDMAAWLARQ